MNLSGDSIFLKIIFLKAISVRSFRMFFLQFELSKTSTGFLFFSSLFFLFSFWDPDLDDQVSTVRITQEFTFLKEINQMKYLNRQLLGICDITEGCYLC